MDENKNNAPFSYTYSAKQQEEVKAIRQKYLPKEDKMEQLRQLDRSVTKRGTILSLIIGVIGALIMGTGMSLVMVWSNFIFGIIIGIVGMVGVALAYPIYIAVSKKQREQVAPQIKALTDELLKQK